jgi:hypothetical protein
MMEFFRDPPSVPLHTITKVTPLDGGLLELVFDDDGVTRTVDLQAMLAIGGVFAPLREPVRWATVKITDRGHALVWRVPGGEDVDLSANALYLTATGSTFMPSSEAGTELLYDADILLWSEQQAELLRQRSANALDWDNLAEEITDVGRSQLHAVESHLILALLHDLKAEAWPLSRDVEHWRAEARGHRDDARRHFTPSMAQRIDIANLYRQARRRMPTKIDETLPLPASVPDACPVTLAELLNEDTA